MPHKYKSICNEVIKVEKNQKRTLKHFNAIRHLTWKLYFLYFSTETMYYAGREAMRDTLSPLEARHLKS